VTIATQQRPRIIRARDIPPGPRGLGGYCWHEDSRTGLHCTLPVGLPHRDHWHAYTKTSWT
jgi:hypothetical protein